jgi:hypothetical protein
MRWIEFISFIYAFKNWEIQENSWLFMRLDLSEHSTDQSRFGYFHFLSYRNSRHSRFHLLHFQIKWKLWIIQI